MAMTGRRPRGDCPHPPRCGCQPSGSVHAGPMCSVLPCGRQHAACTDPWAATGKCACRTAGDDRNQQPFLKSAWHACTDTWRQARTCLWRAGFETSSGCAVGRPISGERCSYCGGWSANLTVAVPPLPGLLPAWPPSPLPLLPRATATATAAALPPATPYCDVKGGGALPAMRPLPVSAACRLMGPCPPSSPPARADMGGVQGPTPPPSDPSAPSGSGAGGSGERPPGLGVPMRL